MHVKIQREEELRCLRSRFECCTRFVTRSIARERKSFRIKMTNGEILPSTIFKATIRQIIRYLHPNYIPTGSTKHTHSEIYHLGKNLIANFLILVSPGQSRTVDFYPKPRSPLSKNGSTDSGSIKIRRKPRSEMPRRGAKHTIMLIIMLPRWRQLEGFEQPAAIRRSVMGVRLSLNE